MSDFSASNHLPTFRDSSSPLYPPRYVSPIVCVFNFTVTLLSAHKYLQVIIFNCCKERTFFRPLFFFFFFNLCCVLCFGFFDIFSRSFFFFKLFCVLCFGFFLTFFVLFFVIFPLSHHQSRQERDKVVAEQRMKLRKTSMERILRNKTAERSKQQAPPPSSAAAAAAPFPRRGRDIPKPLQDSIVTPESTPTKPLKPPTSHSPLGEYQACQISSSLSPTLASGPRQEEARSSTRDLNLRARGDRTMDASDDGGDGDGDRRSSGEGKGGTTAARQRNEFSPLSVEQGAGTPVAGRGVVGAAVEPSEEGYRSIGMEIAVSPSPADGEGAGAGGGSEKPRTGGILVQGGVSPANSGEGEDGPPATTASSASGGFSNQVSM